jgi:hypothetical protein
VVFEIIINILLLVFTGGLGNIARASTAYGKIVAGLRIFAKEAFSVVTFGIVDFLQFFGSIIAGFVKACSKGLKGFFRWVEELVKGMKGGKGKSADEVLRDAENAGDLERRISDLFDDLGGRLLNEKNLYGVDLRLIDKEKAFEKLPVTRNGKTQWIRSSEMLKDWDRRRVVGKFHEGPPPVMILRSNNASELTVFHEKVHLEVWYNKLPKMHIVDEEKLVFEEIFKAKFGWTDDELIDAYDYVNEVVGKANRSRKNFSNIYNDYVQQLKINKQFNIR